MTSTNDKQIRFSFKVDAASLQSLRQSLREIISDFQKFSDVSQKAMGSMVNVAGQSGGSHAGAGGLNLGRNSTPESKRALASAPPAARGIVQTFADQRNLFKGLADGSKDSLRVMTDALKQALATQKNEIKSLDDAAAKLIARYDSLGKEIASLKGHGNWDPTLNAVMSSKQGERNAILQQMTSTVGARGNAVANRDALLAQGRSAGMLPPPLPTPLGPEDFSEVGPAAGPSRWARANAWMQGRGSGLMRAGLRAGGIALAGANAIGTEVMAGYSGMLGLQANRNALTQPLFDRAMSGDIKTLVALQGLGSEQMSDVKGLYSGGAAGTGRLVQRLKEAGLNVSGLRGLLGGGTDKNIGVGGVFTSANGANLQTKQLTEAIQLIEAAQSPMARHAMDQFSGQLSSRVQVQRILGVGLNRMRSKSGILMEGYDDTYGKLAGSLMRSGGYDPAELAAATMQMRGLVGRGAASGLAFNTMHANALGYQGYGELAGMGTRLGIGDRFARGAIGGNIDQFAGLQLGQGIMGSGFDLRGTTNGLGTLAAAQRWMGSQPGAGGAGDFLNAQRVQAGLQVGDQITTGGSSPYQAAFNLVTAMHNNPGASTLSTDYLSQGLGFKQMLDIASGESPLTGTARAMGQTREDIRKQLYESVGGQLKTIRSPVGGRREPWMGTLDKFQASGLDLPTFLKTTKDPNAAENLMGAWNITQFGGANEEGVKGMLGLLEGAGAGGPKSGKMKGGVSGVNKDALEANAKNIELMASKLGEIGQAMSKGYGGISGFAQNIEEFNTNMSATFDKFIKALDKAADHINGKFGDSPTAPGPVSRAAVKATQGLGVVRASSRGR